MTHFIQMYDYIVHQYVFKINVFDDISFSVREHRLNSTNYNKQLLQVRNVVIMKEIE